MRKFLNILIFCFLFFTINSANAQGINFQGSARSANGIILSSQKISLRFSIITGAITNTPDYVETRVVTTNGQGIFSVIIGDTATTSTIGTFSAINWKTGNKSLKVEMDPAGGINYILIGVTLLQYVPYSFYSNGVDAANVNGILSVKSGGTGVDNLNDFKVALGIDKLNNTPDTVKLISKPTQTALDSKLNKSDTTIIYNRIESISNRPINTKYDIKVNGFTIGRGGNADSTNMIFGKDALINNTTGFSNIAFGISALALNTKGVNNLAIGHYALGSNIISNANLGIGGNALRFNTGENNVSIGYASLQYNTTGGHNTAFGVGSLSNNTTSSSNAAFGTSSLNKNTTGTGNVGIGTFAMQNNTTGNYNTGVGHSVLSDNQTGKYLTAIGHVAGLKIKSGMYNTFLGSYTGSSIDSINNATAIGFGATVNESNTIQLGNSEVVMVKTNGRFTSNGIQSSFKSVNTSYNILLSDEIIKADATSGALTILLPNAADIIGQTFTIKRVNVGVNNVNLTTSSNQTIDGNVNYTLNAQYRYVKVVSDGANWIIIGNN